MAPRQVSCVPYPTPCPFRPATLSEFCITSVAEAQALKAAVDEKKGSTLDEFNHPWVHIFEQGVGDCVNIPAGCVHSVYNLQANFKVSWERLVPSELHLYIDAWLRVGVHLYSDTPDFLCVEKAALIMLRRYTTFF